MKQKLLNSIRLRVFMLMALLCATFSGTVWAESNVSTVSTKFSANGDVTTKFNQTGTFTSAGWNLSVTWASSESWQNLDGTKGAQVGSGSKPATGIVLTGSGISGTISSVVVNTSGANSVNATVAVTVGGTTFKCNGNNTASLTNSAANYEFTGSGSGDIVVTWANSSSKAIYIKSVTTTYSASTLEDNNLALTGAPIALSFDLYNNSASQEISYTTSSTGAVTVSESDYVTTSVDAVNKKITVSPKSLVTPSTQTITVSQAADETYNAGAKTFTVTITDSTPIPTHTVTFNVNGNATGNEVEEGANIDFPTNIADIYGKKFVGWVATPIDGTTDEAPEFVNTATQTMGESDVTYYAVFAEVVEGASTTETLTYDASQDNGFPKSYAASDDYDLDGVSFNITQIFDKDTYFQWRAQGNSNGTGALYNNEALNVQTIVITYTDGDSNKNISLKVGDKLNPTDGTSIIPSSSGNVYTFDCSNDNNGYFVLTNGSGAGYTSSIVITYKSGTPDTYSAYCTSVVAAAVERPTITVDETFVGSTTATITCATDGATIYYSFDNENWTEYTDDLNITATTTIYAKATKDTDESEVASATTTKVLPTPTVAVSGDLTEDLNGEASVSAGTLTAAVTYEQAEVEGATVTWSSSDEAIATIDANGAVTLLATGEVTFTATYAGNEDYAEATGTKTITVINSQAPGTEARPYTVAEAIAAIDAGTGLTGVYATGIVSEIVTAYNSQYGNITYNISADGLTTSDQLQAYRGKSYNGDNFTSADDIQVGDIVVVYGNLTKYNSTYEFGQNNQLVSLSRKPATPTFSPAEGAVASGTEVTIESVTDGTTIYYTTDGTEPTANSNVFDGAIAITEETTIKAIAVKDETSSDVATAHYTIAVPVATPTFSVAAGTYDTAQAVEITCATDGATIYYSFDNENWTEYTEALNIDEDKTVYAKAEKDGMAQSEVASVEYTFEIPSITFTEATPKNLTYEEQDYDFAFTTHYTSGNPEVVVCDYQGTPKTYNWFSAEILNGVVRVSLAKNEDSENGRTAYFKVTAGNAESEIYTVIQGNFVVDYAELPFAFNDGKAAIEETTGLTQDGLGSDYASAPKLKFDHTGDNLVLKINERPGILTFDIKGNGFSGGTFTVQTSEDGQTYTDLKSYTVLSDTQSEEFDNLGENVRYIKWIYTSKSSGNVALGNIALAEYVEPVLTPTVTVSETAINATAEETDGTITVTYENITEINADVFICDANGNSATYDWFDAEINKDNNNVAYTIGANTGDARTGYLKVYALDDNANDVYSELITITQAGYVAPAAGEKYNLFTGELVEGDYIIYYDGKAMNTTVESDRLQYEAVTPENDVITTNNAAIVWHIAKSGDYWTIYNAEADAYAASTGAKNKAQMLAEGTDDKALWTVSGTKTFDFVNKANDANKVNAYLRNNGTYGFACYADGTGGTLSLYKKAGVKLNASGYATFASTKAVDFTHSETNGYSAWAVTAINGTEITFTQIQTAVAAGTGVLLKGTASTEIDPVYVEEGEAVEGNKLVGITEATEVIEGEYYGLKGNNFVEVNPGTVPAGKALLPASEVTAGNVKALTFVFNDIATGVRTIETVSAEEAAKIFNLGGQRVDGSRFKVNGSGLKTGIYIVNGKKVLVK